MLRGHPPLCLDLRPGEQGVSFVTGLLNYVILRQALSRVDVCPHQLPASLPLLNVIPRSVPSRDRGLLQHTCWANPAVLSGVKQSHLQILCHCLLPHPYGAEQSEESPSPITIMIHHPLLSEVQQKHVLDQREGACPRPKGGGLSSTNGRGLVPLISRVWKPALQQAGPGSFPLS